MDWWGGGSRGVTVKATDSGILVSEFVLQSRYYSHFRVNAFRKGMNPLISYRINSTTTVLQGE